MLKKLLSSIYLLLLLTTPVFAELSVPEKETTAEKMFIKAAITKHESTEILKSTIFDASLSFIPKQSSNIVYEWEFGDGNNGQGLEVLHTYKNPGFYNVKLKIYEKDNPENFSEDSLEIFAYRKMVILLTDIPEKQDWIPVIKNYSENHGVFLKVIDSFGSNTDFISEELLSKKISEEITSFQKAEDVIIFTNENAGLNALSRNFQNTYSKNKINLGQKNLILISNDIEETKDRIQKQFSIFEINEILMTKEAAITNFIDSRNYEEFKNKLKEGGYDFVIINEETGKTATWKFMTNMVNTLIGNGIPDNIIILILLLPLIVTVVSIMKQVVGFTTFGVYIPTIITFTFLITGLQIGLITLLLSLTSSLLSMFVIKRINMMLIPKYSVSLIITSIFLIVFLTIGIKFEYLSAQYLSVAIFPLLILCTLPEKLISIRSERGILSGLIIFMETMFTAILAYIISGGEVNLYFFTLKVSVFKNFLLYYPEIIIILIFVNIMLGRWSGLRLLESIKFRELLRHDEE